MDSNVSATVRPDAGTPFSRRDYLLFIVFIAILGSFSSLVNDMYLPAVPAMMREFHTTPSMTQLSISATMLGLGIGSVVWGSLSDRFGRELILLISLAIFVIGTVMSMLSTSITFFNVCRLLQGFGAGGSMVMSYSIPADRFIGRQLAVIMALVGALNGFVPAVAPLAGGFLAKSYGWKGVFVVLLIVGGGMWLWTSRRPESLPPSRRLKVTGIGSYLQAYSRLIHNRPFMTYAMTKSIAIGLLFAYISSAPFIMQTHYGLSESRFGLVFGANALSLVCGATLVSRLKNIRHALLWGGATMCLGALIEAVVLWLDSGLTAYELALVPMLFGSGMVFSTSNALSMEEGRADAGSASALLNVAKYIFAAIVVPLVGLDDIMCSTGIVFVCVAVVSAMLLIGVGRLKPAQ